MTKITIEKNRTTQLEITTSDNTILHAKGNVFDSQGNGIVESGDASGNDYIINGTILAHGGGNPALSFGGADTTVTVGEHGKLKSEYWGIRAFGDNARIVNEGRIESTVVGIAVAGEDSRIINRGTIVTDGDAFQTDNLAKLRVDNDGTIRADKGLDFRVENLTLNFGKESVVTLDENGSIDTTITTTGAVIRINNAGTIEHRDNGMIAAISGGDGRELVRNTGTMEGFVSLGGGNDRFDGRDGRVHGTVLGGEGDDTYLLSSSKDKISEAVGWGNDTLKLTCSYTLADNNEIELTRLMGKGDFDITGNALDNRLVGNRGDNHLIGGAGTDELWGGAGRDVITGGTGADAFYFRHNADVEIITDFKQGEDILALSVGDDIRSIADLLAHHIRQDGKDLVISGDGTEMILKNIDRDDLTAMDWDLA